jgi:hypothetical protein
MASGLFPEAQAAQPAIRRWRLLTSLVCCIFFQSEMQPTAALKSTSLFSGAKAGAPRKPVIYLYPPSRLLDVIVELLLTSSWSFSAVYPSPQTAIPSGENSIGAQSLTWAVDAEPDGKLVEKTTGTEVTYLYWEAA